MGELHADRDAHRRGLVGTDACRLRVTQSGHKDRLYVPRPAIADVRRGLEHRGFGFNLRQTIPRTTDLDELRKFVELKPTAVIVVERDRKAKADPPLPYLLEESTSDRNGNDIMEFYTRIGQPMLP